MVRFKSCILCMASILDTDFPEMDYEEKMEMIDAHLEYVVSKIENNEQIHF